MERAVRVGGRGGRGLLEEGRVWREGVSDIRPEK